MGILKRKIASDSNVTGWKIAGTYAANEGKTAHSLVSSYGGKKFPKGFSSNEQRAGILPIGGIP